MHLFLLAWVRCGHRTPCFLFSEANVGLAALVQWRSRILRSGLPWYPPCICPILPHESPPGGLRAMLGALWTPMALRWTWPPRKSAGRCATYSLLCVLVVLSLLLQSKCSVAVKVKAKDINPLNRPPLLFWPLKTRFGKPPFIYTACKTMDCTCFKLITFKLPSFWLANVFNTILSF